MVLAKFAELQSVRQVVFWLREEGIPLATAQRGAVEGASHHLAVTALRRRARHPDQPRLRRRICLRANSQQGQRGGKKQDRGGARSCGARAKVDVLLKDQHEGYISWTEFERNQRVIAENATGKGSAVARGAAQQGELLLAGLLRCGHCGRKMFVAYGGKAGRYHCEGALVNHGAQRAASRLAACAPIRPSARKCSGS